MTLPDLTGRVAVVIGGASGIGAATAESLSVAGASVVVADLYPRATTDMTVDIASAESIDTLARQVEAEHGTCSYLVLCAGTVAVGPMETADESDWDRLFDVNAKGPWMTVRAFLPLLTAADAGASVLTVASGVGLRPLPELSIYAASKAAVIGLSRALATELADRGVRVNCLSPGLVDTPMARDAQGARGTEAAGQTAAFSNYLVRRFGAADELAQAAIMLLTNEYITGSTLAVDGGRTLH
jgi:NAD(P)-dependent dehydrogenase (short-subunit alcohol dehydrogenase family)